MFVFYEGTTAAGATLNSKKFGILCGNHIYIVVPKDERNQRILREINSPLSPDLPELGGKHAAPGRHAEFRDS